MGGRRPDRDCHQYSCTLCDLSHRRSSACIRRDRRDRMQHVYEPQEFGLHVTAGAAAGDSGMGCADVRLERNCVCADRAAAAVCDGPNQWYEPRCADGVWGWLQRSDDRGANGMGIWRNLYRLRGPTLGPEGRGGEAGTAKIVCDRLGWYAWGIVAGCCGVVAVRAAGWKQVSAEKYDHLSGLLLDCGDIGGPGIDAAMAHSKAGIVRACWHEN